MRSFSAHLASDGLWAFERGRSGSFFSLFLMRMGEGPLGWIGGIVTRDGGDGLGWDG